MEESDSNVLGNYNSVKNEVVLVCGTEDFEGTIYHELWHWEQAEQYRMNHGNITDDNYGEYFKWLIKPILKDC